MPDRVADLLAATAARIEWPEPGDLAARVRTEIAARPVAKRREWHWRAAYVGAALLVVIAATLVFSPATRRAVADLLGVGSVRITFDDRAPSPTIGTEFDFGRAVSLAQARALADFPVPVPHDVALGDADAVFFDADTPPGGQVALVYGDGPGLPASGADAAVIFTVFPADLSTGDFFKKVAAGGTRVMEVDIEDTPVDSIPGYWLEGEPHLFYYEDPTTGVSPESVRLVGNVLLWEAGDLTLRLEVGDLDLERALEIARSVR